MSFLDDVLDEPFLRPAVRIRILGPDGEELETIEIPELTIDHPFAESTEEQLEPAPPTPLHGERNSK